MKKLTAIALSTAIAAGGAFAATQGSLGLSSTGSVDITLSIPDSVRIQNLVDIPLGQADGVNALSGSSPACVFRNGASGNYQITASGSGAANAFTLASGGNTIAYTATYDDGSGASALTTGVALTGQTGADNASQDCSTGANNNGTIAVSVSAAAQNGAAVGNYSGTLTLTVAAE